MLWHCERLPHFYWPRSEVHTDKSTDPLQDHSKKVSSAAPFTINTTVFNFLTSRTKMLHAYEIRHMFFCRVRMPLILRGLKIIKYMQYIVRVSRQNVLQRSHKTQVAHISVLVTDFTISLITFMVSARHEGPTRSAISPAFTHGFLIRSTLCFAQQA